MKPDELLARACARFMNDPELAPLRRWWAADVIRTVVPLEPLRLAAREGDRARLLTIAKWAARHGSGNFPDLDIERTAGDPDTAPDQTDTT